MGLSRRLQELFGKSLVQNFLALAAVQLATFALPFITYPFVVRILSLETWGLLMRVQSFAVYIVLLIEYGFFFSATRQIAQHRDDREVVADIVAGVQGAKAVLALVALLPVALVLYFEPTFRQHPLLFWAGFTWALMQAFHPLWFFQGMDRMRLVSGVDIFAKCCATAGIFLLLRSPTDAWKWFALQALAAGISATFGIVYMLRTVKPRFPTRAHVRDALRSGFTVALSRGAVMLYAANNSFIFGWFQSDKVVGIYAGAEKLFKPVVALTLAPLNQAIYPRIAYLLHRSRREAAEMAYKAVFVFMAVGLLLAVGVYLTAPLVVHIILGKAFADSVPVLRIMALNLPLVALSMVLGIMWMIPLRMDRTFNLIAFTAGIANISIAAIVAPRYGAPGMGCTTVVAEIIVTAGTFLMLRLRRMDPASLRHLPDAPLATTAAQPGQPEPAAPNALPHAPDAADAADAPQHGIPLRR